MSGYELMLVQVRVPVCVTLYLKREDVEWMTREDLAAVVEEVLEAEATPSDKQLTADTDTGPAVPVKYQVNPSWDMLPADECDLVFEEDEGLFPMAD
jgi:hypothetical protein